MPKKRFGAAQIVALLHQILPPTRGILRNVAAIN